MFCSTVKKAKNWPKCWKKAEHLYSLSGKNDHSADILEVERVEVETTDPAGQRIDSLFPEESFLMDELEAYSFKYRETLPVGLKEETNQYEYRKFAFSDEIVEEAKQTVFQVQGKNIIFY